MSIHAVDRKLYTRPVWQRMQLEGFNESLDRLANYKISIKNAGGNPRKVTPGMELMKREVDAYATNLKEIGFVS